MVTMNEVAAAAQVGKATLYRYFPSKEDLYVAVFDDALEDLASQLESATSGGGSAAVVIRRMLELLVPALSEHLRGLRSIDDGLVQLAERKRRLFRTRRSEITRRVQQVLASGTIAGEVRAIDPRFAADVIVGMVWSSVVHGSDSPVALAMRVCDLFLYGVMSDRNANPNEASRNGRT